jgi:hypothetical protein
VIPASVTTICGNAFGGSAIRRIAVESGSEHFSAVDDFLLDITGTRLVTCFALGATQAIPGEIEVICESSFPRSQSLSRLVFEPDSQLRRVERLAFARCLSLHTIRFPAAVELLERDWFRNSHSDDVVLFDTVQFESAESLATMLAGDCADLRPDFAVEVLNWNGETVIPGYCVDIVLSENWVRLKKAEK